MAVGKKFLSSSMPDTWSGSPCGGCEWGSLLPRSNGSLVVSMREARPRMLQVRSSVTPLSAGGQPHQKLTGLLANECSLFLSRFESFLQLLETILTSFFILAPDPVFWVKFLPQVGLSKARSTLKVFILKGNSSFRFRCKF